MSLEHLEHETAEFAHHHPLLVKGALVIGGVALLIGGARWALRKIGVL